MLFFCRSAQSPSLTHRASGDKLSIQYAYPSARVRYEDVQLTLEAPGTEYSATDCILHLTVNVAEYWSMWAHTPPLMRSVTSNYTKKRLWLLCLSKITKTSAPSVRARRRPNSRADSLYHSFSSPSHLYFSARGIEGIHFVEDQVLPQPSPVMRSEPNPDSKVCSNCSARILFMKSVQCYRCGRVFCKNCCNQRVLDRSGDGGGR